MTTFIIYISSVLKVFSILLFVLAAVVFIYLLLVYCILCDQYGIVETHTRFGKTLKSIGLFGVIITFLGVLIPNQDTVYLMLGSAYTESPPQTDEAKKVRIIINKKLDELVKESK